MCCETGLLKGVDHRAGNWETTLRAMCPPLLPHQVVTHISPRVPLLASPSSNRDQETAPRDPKAKCKRALSSSPPRSRGALGWGSALLQPGLCVPGEAAPPGGKKSLSHSAPGKWMPHASFPGEEGPFRLFLAAGGQGEGVPLTGCYRL